MVKCILLDNEENFLKFLDPDLISLEETREQYAISSINTVYTIDDPVQARELFKVGHKIFVVDDKNLRDCLYVIPESLKHDFFDENNVEFDAEEVLTELNFILFSHVSNSAVTVDRDSLDSWFGDYFQIGVVQPCLSDAIAEIDPVGTMSLMELLRLIEEETSNVFVTRYEKDVGSNGINKYLDFLNPKSKKDQWNLCFDYVVPQDCESESGEMTLENYGAGEESLVSDSQGDGDDVKFPKRKDITVDVTSFELRILEDDIVKVVFDASELGLGGHSEVYSFDIDYEESSEEDYNLLVKVRGYSYSSTLADNPNALSHMEETDTNQEGVTSDEILGTHLTIQLVDTADESVVYQQKIQPIMNKTIGDVFDLGFNVENITLEVEESDSFNAVAPKISQDNEQSKTDITNIVQKWLNLEVTKGDKVPMIVQKVTSNTKPSNRSASNVGGAYWTRPLHPNDTTDSNNNVVYEYLEGTAYWRAPFTKLQGEMFVVDDEDTGIEYNAIYGRADFEETDGCDSVSTPKLCLVETSDEDPYSIFNDVCMKLKDKRFPDVNIEVDVKDYHDRDNSFDIFDKVYVKIPNFSKIVIASVNKTVKNAYDVGENTVELSNYTCNTKVAPAETMIDGENPTNVVYPNLKLWSIQVVNLEDNDTKVDWRLVSFNLQKVDDNGNTSNVNTYNVITDNTGVATLNLNYEPGIYKIEANFGGDAEFAASSATFEFTVGGKITKSNPISSSSVSKKNKTKKVTKKSYYTKFGVSPDEKTIMVVGKASTNAEKNRYGANKFWKVKLLRKCPKCKSTHLFWGWNWGSEFRGRTEGGSSEGRIICDKCGASYTIFGNGGSKDLTIVDKPVESSKTEANKLKNGRLLYDSWTVNVKVKKKTKNNKGVINRSGFSCTNKLQTGVVKDDVKKQAKAIVDNRTGVKAAKAIVKWVVGTIKYESRDGFYQSPSRTLQRKKGNDRCMCDLILHMCDAVGVMNDGIACYYVYSVKKTKKKTVSHVFLRINGKWVDPLKKNAWGNYKTGYGAIKKAKQTRYPCLPHSKKY